uniref:Glycosyl transferase family 25 domain-containing protein n=1 Tax=viral metagenome TaxID=1070528 RepID=A0A6C0I0K0_9ZZZZ
MNKSNKSNKPLWIYHYILYNIYYIMSDFEIYVLNLDKDKDRLDEITKKLNPNKFTRISGIYGKNINMDEYPEVLISSKYLTPKSAIGCELTHRKAIKQFLYNSKLDYAVILEDDAVPVNNNCMEEIQRSIKNAPPDWDIIKLDYWPNYSSEYNTYPSLLTTGYIINKKSANKILDYKVIYHYDVDLNFTNLKIYNNPKIIFQQIWDEKNASNNRIHESYNPFTSLYEGLNFKIIRVFNIEFTFADFILLFIIIIVVNIGYYYKFFKPFYIINTFSSKGRRT